LKPDGTSRMSREAHVRICGGRRVRFPPATRQPRARRQLTPEEKWEIFLEVTSQEISQADAARKYGVDVSVIVRLRALAKDAAMAAFA
jgi:transposase-like protein